MGSFIKDVCKLGEVCFEPIRHKTKSKLGIALASFSLHLQQINLLSFVQRLGQPWPKLGQLPLSGALYSLSECPFSYLHVTILSEYNFNMLLIPNGSHIGSPTDCNFRNYSQTHI